MEAIEKELVAVLRCAHNKTKNINKNTMKKKTKQESLIVTLEDALSEVYCMYALDLANSLVFETTSDPEIHKTLKRVLQLLGKTKKEIGKYVSMYKKDPITEEYLHYVLSLLGYTVNNK